METIHKKNDFNKFNNYTFFIVRACQGKVFFLNKNNNLVYGKHLKELIKRGVAMKILFQNTLIHSQSEV